VDIGTPSEKIGKIGSFCVKPGYPYGVGFLRKKEGPGVSIVQGGEKVGESGGCPNTLSCASYEGDWLLS